MNRLGRALGMRPGEGGLVGLVAGTFAALEAARGFGEIGADTLFISRFGAGFLPLAFIGLGILSLVVSLVYGAALGRIRRGPLFVGLVTGIGALVVVERLLLGLIGDAVLPALWLTVYAAGAIVVTLAWTLAGAVFNARQAKRLFPLLTSAAIIGSFVGTVGAGPVATLLGTETLVVVQAVLLVGAAVLIGRIARTEAATRLRAAPAGRPVADELRVGLDYVVRSPLMRLVALAYVVFSVLLFSVSFPFLRAMAEAFPTEAELATALGLLSAGITVTSFLVSLLVANRLYARFGVATAALVLPVVYLGGFGLWIVSFSVASAALVRFAQQVTQRGISNAAWSAFYNVVPGERRAQVMAFNDGVPGQLGIALSGVLLIAADSLLAPDQVFWLGLGAAAVCTVIVLAIRRIYAGSLVATLRAGLGEQILEGGPGLDALARDAQVADGLVRALAAPEASVRQMAAELIGRVRAVRAESALAERVADADAGVRAAALAGLAALGRTAHAGAVASGLADPDGDVRAAAVRALAALDPMALQDRSGAIASDPDPDVRAALAVALVRAGEEERPHALLAALLEGSGEDERLAGLAAVAELGGHSPSARMPELLGDPLPRVRAAAVRALAATNDRDEAGTAAIVAALDDDAREVRRAAALALRDEPAPPAGVLAALDRGSGRAQEAALLALDGHGDAIREPLLAWAAREVERADDLRRQETALAAADGRARETAGAGPRGSPDGSVDFLRFLVGRRGEEIQGRLLNALAVLGAEEAGGLIRRCLRSGDPEIRAQAIEALDSLGDRRLRRSVVRLVEAPPDPVPGAEAEVLRRLADDPDPWIRALALRAWADRLVDDWQGIMDRGRADADPLVRLAMTPLVDGGPSMPDTTRTLGDLDRMLFLRQVPLFAGLAPEDLQRVAASAAERLYPAGEAIVREGDIGDELVVIVEGAVRVVHVEPDGSERLLRRYAAGDHIGELAVLRSRPRAATVIAEAPVRGLVIGGEALTAILRERPEAAMAMLATLAERIGTAPR